MQETRPSCCDHNTGIRYTVRSWLFYIGSRLQKLLGQMKQSRHSSFIASLESKHEVAIMYFGRASEFLLMTSERMAIPDETYTLEQVLSRLRERGGRWAYELDDQHVVCTINGKNASLLDTIEVGIEIGIFSRKSIFGT